MKTVSIEKCPYRCRMFWYAANWDQKTAHVYDTKQEAVTAAIASTESGHINVSWIEDSMKNLTPWSLAQSIWQFEVTYHGSKLK